MVEKELEWVKSHVHNNKNESSSQAKVGIRDVADCQAFVMTAPGPGLEGDAIYQQREFASLFPSLVPHFAGVWFSLPFQIFL